MPTGDGDHLAGCNRLGSGNNTRFGREENLNLTLRRDRDWIDRSPSQTRKRRRRKLRRQSATGTGNSRSSCCGCCCCSCDDISCTVTGKIRVGPKKIECTLVGIRGGVSVVKMLAFIIAETPVAFLPLMSKSCFVVSAKLTNAWSITLMYSVSG